MKSIPEDFANDEGGWKMRGTFETIHRQHNKAITVMLLNSLGIWLRHKLDIFGSKLTVFQNLIRSVTDINNIIASQLFVYRVF